MIGDLLDILSVFAIVILAAILAFVGALALLRLFGVMV